MADQTLSAQLQVEGVGRLTLRVSALEVEEALSELYRARVEARAVEPVKVEDLVDKPASIHVEVGEARRSFHGVVAEAAVEVARDDGVRRVRVVVAPRLWRCGLGLSSRLFQDASLPDVVKKLLAEGGVERASWKLREKHPVHPFVMQLQESDLAFARRLLAESGIGFCFTQGEDGEELLLFDESAQLEPIEGNATLFDRRSTDLEPEVVWAVRERRATTSDAVAMKDYDLRRPRLDLSVKEQAGDAGREVYVHPGGHDELPEGKRRAKARLEGLRAAGRSFSAKSTCPRLAPGRTFTLQGHPRTGNNIDHLVVAVRHRALIPADGAEGTPIYENAFETIPADVPWRPAPADARLPFPGPQLAFVTCPRGEEIHCDDYGRVKALFNFDRRSPGDDRSSTWMRVGQLALGGAIVLPRKDFEVLAAFELGDVDRPLIAGHLYNGEAMPPYALPGGKTRSSLQSATTSGGAGSNELRFEDAAGSEEIFLNASKDMSVTAMNDATEVVTKDQKQKVVGARKLTVGEDLQALVTGNRKLTVSASQEVKVNGKLSDGVGGSESHKVGAVRKLEVAGDKVDSVKGSFKREVAALQVVTGITGVTLTTVGASEVRVGAVWGELTAGNRMSSCGGDRTERTGAVKLVKAKAMSVTTGGDLTTTAGVLSTKADGGRTDAASGALFVTAGGGLSADADAITFEAKAALTLIAGSLKMMLLPVGVVLLSASEVDLCGVEELDQLLNQSN